jgi:DNA-binding XRE family transcriptional regulator
MTRDPRLGQASDYPATPGSLAGAVLQAARRSAQASEESIADAIDLTVHTYLKLEAGTIALDSLPMPMLESLILALKDAGAMPEIVVDIEVAAWADLVLDAIASRDEVACLLADPITHDGRFAELVTWALTGRPPTRYRPYGTRALLVRDHTLVTAFVELLRMAWLEPCETSGDHVLTNT